MAQSELLDKHKSPNGYGRKRNSNASRIIGRVAYIISASCSHKPEVPIVSNVFAPRQSVVHRQRIIVHDCIYTKYAVARSFRSAELLMAAVCRPHFQQEGHSCFIMILRQTLACRRSSNGEVLLVHKIPPHLGLLSKISTSRCRVLFMLILICWFYVSRIQVHAMELVLYCLSV